MNHLALLIVVIASIGSAYAQENSGQERTAEYAVRITDGRSIATLPSQTWKVRPARQGNGIEIDFGNDNIQVHDSEIAVYAEDDDSHVIESFRPHPQVAQARGTKKWIGFAERWKREEGKHPTLADRWPIFYQLIENGEATTFVADHFLSDGTRIIWRRMYHRDDFFMPGAVMKEVYTAPGSVQADYVITYRKVE